MARTISYSVVGQWQLPETVKFNNGNVKGYFTSIDSGGDWQTSTDLGTVNRNAAVNRSLSITPQAGRSIVNYAIRGTNLLPIGLYLNSTTGTLTGTVSLWPRESAEAEFRLTPIPTWNTASDLGAKDEGDAVSVAFSATANLGTTVTYTVLSGTLPWGLYMPRNGTLAGTLGFVEPSEAHAEKMPKPTITGFTTSATNAQAFNQTVSATAPEGQTIANYVVAEGNLPWGLRLMSTTGQITGTVNIPSTGMPATTTYNFKVRVTTNTGAHQTADFSISIS